MAVTIEPGVSHIITSLTGYQNPIALIGLGLCDPGAIHPDDAPGVQRSARIILP